MVGVKNRYGDICVYIELYIDSPTPARIIQYACYNFPLYPNFPCYVVVNPFRHHLALGITPPSLALLVRRNLGDTQPELHLLGSNRVRSNFCARVDKSHLLRVGHVVCRPLGIAGVDESVGIASNDD
jgi:hypothetical protein